MGYHFYGSFPIAVTKKAMTETAQLSNHTQFRKRQSRRENERIREILEDCVLSRANIRIKKCQFHSNIVHINFTVKIYRLKNYSVFMQIIVSNTSGSKEFWFM